MPFRLIPRLDIKGPNLVKGIHLEGLRVLGPPEVFARRYYEDGADELLFMDAVASLYGRNSLLDVIERTAKEIFIPLTVGGGLRTIEDISAALRAGADKVAINTAAIARPEFVREAAERFGSSTIVVSIDAKRAGPGKWLAYTDCGRQNSFKDAVLWAKQAASYGAGEILVTSVDQEGTGRGMDIELIGQIATAIPVPVIACGGVGEIRHVSEAVTQGHADAICLASVLHYAVVRELEASDFVFGSGGEFSVIRERREFRRITPASLESIKEQLTQIGIRCPRRLCH